MKTKKSRGSAEPLAQTCQTRPWSLVHRMGKVGTDSLAVAAGGGRGDGLRMRATFSRVAAFGLACEALRGEVEDEVGGLCMTGD
jgi:hypothetical protein